MFRINPYPQLERIFWPPSALYGNISVIGLAMFPHWFDVFTCRKRCFCVEDKELDTRFYSPSKLKRNVHGGFPRMVIRSRTCVFIRVRHWPSCQYYNSVASFPPASRFLWNSAWPSQKWSFSCCLFILEKRFVRTFLLLNLIQSIQRNLTLFVVL